MDPVNDRARINMVIDPRNSLYRALQLPMDSRREDIEAAIDNLQRVFQNSSVRALAARLDQARTTLLDEARRSEYDTGLREQLHRELDRVAASLFDDDDKLDADEYNKFMAYGATFGVPVAELETIVQPYLARNATVHPAEPAPVAGPATFSEAGAVPGTMSPDDRITVEGPIGDPVHWATVASAVGAGVSVLVVTLLTHLGRPSVRMAMLAAAVAVGTFAVHKRRKALIVGAIAASGFIAFGNPILLGAVVGVVGAAAMAWFACGRGRGRAQTACISCIVLTLCLALGAILGPGDLKAGVRSTFARATRLKSTVDSQSDRANAPAKVEAATTQARSSRVRHSPGDYVDYDTMDVGIIGESPRNEIVELDRLLAGKRVLMHPHQRKPCGLEASVALDRGPASLEVGILGHPRGDFRARILGSGSGRTGKPQVLWDRVIVGRAGLCRESIDLSAYAGGTVNLILECSATDWHFEYVGIDYFYVLQPLAN